MTKRDFPSWGELVRWAEYGEAEQNGRDEGVIPALAQAAEDEIRADERAQLAAGDVEACAGWLRYTLDALGVSAGRSDDLAEELAALVGSFAEMKSRDERDLIVAYLRARGSQGYPALAAGGMLEAANAIEKGAHREPR